MQSDKKRESAIITFTLVMFGVLITLNYFFIRYPGDIFLPLLKAAFLFSAIVIYGLIINLALSRKKTDLFEAVASGLVFTTFYFFILCSLKLVIPLFILLFYLIPFPIAFYLFYKRREESGSVIKNFFKRNPAEFAIFIFPFIYASLPSTFFDTMVYHLGLPNMILLNKGFSPLSQMVYANTSIYYEVSLVPSLFAGDLVPRIFHFLLGVVFCLTLTDMASEYFDLKKRNLFLLVLVFIPLTFFLITTVKNDLISALFILAGLRSYLKGRVKLSAIFWGFSLGVKYFNVLPLAVFLILVFIKNGLKNYRSGLKMISFYAATSFVIILPLLIKNYIFMNNPFFPFFPGVFEHGGYFDIERYRVLKRDVGSLVHNFRDIISFPYDLSFKETGSGGLLGVQFLVFLPILILKRKINSFFLFNFSIILIFSAIFFTSSIRFVYISIAIFAVYTLKIFENLEDRGLRIMKFVLFVIIPLNIFTSFGYHERIYRAFNLYSGKMDREKYKSELLPSYSAISYINSKSPGNSKILMVGETRNFYLKRRCSVSSALDYSILKKYLERSDTVDVFFKNLKNEKIDFIIFNSSEFMRINSEYNRLSAYEIQKFNDFKKSFTTVFREGNSFVYKIPDNN